MKHDFRFEPCEPRRLLSVAALDASFGEGGAVLDAGVQNAAGPILELPNGRYARLDGRSLVYSKPNGARDRARIAAFGSVDTIRDAIARPDGSIVLLRSDSDEDPGVPDSFELAYVGIDGTVGDTRSIPATNVRSIAAGTDGSVLVVSERFDDNDNELVEVRRILADGSVDTDYGDNGVATTQLNADSQGNGQEFYAARSDANGRVYVVFQQNRSSGGISDIEQVVAVRRFEADGDVDGGYGTIVLDNAFALSDVGGSVRYLDMDVAADGSLAVLTWGQFAGENDPVEYDTQLTRVSASGTKRTLNLARPALADPTGRLTIAENDVVYVAIRPRGVLHDIYKIDGITPDETWSNFGPFATLTSAVNVSDVAYVNGRLLVSGETLESFSDLVVGIDGTREDFGVGQNRVERLPDGTVAVNGTRGDDAIVVRSSRGTLIVSLNGKITTFPITGVNGVFVTSLGGNDTIGQEGTFRPLYVIAGAGNDTITGSQASDTILGAEGNDVIYGQAAADDLYGQDGNDVILAGEGADLIYGGAGKDRLFSSSYTFVTDNSTDILFGGSGRDIFDRDEPSGNLPERDDILNSDSNDVVVT